MSDTIIDFETREAFDAFSAKVNAAKRLPCCRCHEQEDPECGCLKHRTPDGRDARPHGPTVAVTYLGRIDHPTDVNRCAVRVDDVVAELVDAQHVDAEIAPEVKAAIVDEGARAKTITSEWIAKASIAEAVEVKK